MTNAPGEAAHGPDAADRMTHDFETASLRNGESPDATSHGQRAVELADARLKAADYAELPANEQAAIELLAAGGGRTTAGDLADVLADTTDYQPATAKAALSRLASKGLVRSVPNTDNFREYIWSLTDAGRAWVRDYGGQR